MPNSTSPSLYGGAQRATTSLSEYAIPTAAIALFGVLRLAQSGFTFDMSAVLCFGVAAALFYIGKE